MNQITQQNFFLVERLVQEEVGERRRSRIKNLLRQIRDWWNHSMESSPDYDRVNERIQEIRNKYASYRTHF